jgi:hypothetical protein
MLCFNSRRQTDRSVRPQLTQQIRHAAESAVHDVEGGEEDEIVGINCI